MPKYQYKVELTRKVKTRDFGIDVYHLDIKRYCFPFGKNTEFKTGKKAKEMAFQTIVDMFGTWTAASIIRETTQGNGTFEYYRTLDDKFFDTGWDS